MVHLFLRRAQTAHRGRATGCEISRSSPAGCSRSTVQTLQHYRSRHHELHPSRGQQMAIGELMTVGEAQLLCMGYAAFSQKWKEDGGMGGSWGEMGGLTATSLPVPEGADQNDGDGGRVAEVGEAREGSGGGSK